MQLSDLCPQPPPNNVGKNTDTLGIWIRIRNIFGPDTLYLYINYRKPNLKKVSKNSKKT